MTFEQIAGLSGAIISLLLALVPGLKRFYQPLDGAQKRVVLIVAMAVVSVGLALYEQDAPAMFSRLLESFGIGLSANQVTHFLYKLLSYLPVFARKPKQDDSFG
jgi:Ni,Fe-hydrogenase I cytochrome b subunit